MNVAAERRETRSAEPVISPTANGVEGHLPVEDTGAIHATLDGADVPTLLMAHTRLSGDGELPERFRPFIRPLMTGGARAIEPRQDAFAASNTRLNARCERMIGGYHRVKSCHRKSAGRLWPSWPYRIVDVRHATRAPIAEEFIVHP